MIKRIFITLIAIAMVLSMIPSEYLCAEAVNVIVAKTNAATPLMKYLIF